MSWEVRQGDSLTELRKLEAGTVQTVVTSPPYWGLRDYGISDQLGLEPTPEEYVSKLVEVFREVRRVLRDDGTVWLNLGDSYAGGIGATGRNDTDRETPGGRGGSFRGGERTITNQRAGLKPKDLCGIPWRVAFALQADGWYLRSDIAWAKPNPMPESVRDRPTRSHEYIFLLTKSARYFFDQEAVREPSEYPDDNRKARQRQDDYDGQMGDGARVRSVINPLNATTYPMRNIRSVWNIATQPYKEAHFATFPEKLVEPCVLAGSSPKACEECGAPWERVVERVDTGRTQKMTDGWATHDGGHGSFHREGREAGETGVPVTEPRTIGWQPTCKCPALSGGEQVSAKRASPAEARGKDASLAKPSSQSSSPESAACLVLDPFCGSGTVGVVALRHNRSFLGLELSPDYCEMARNRIRDDAPLLNTGLEAAA